MVALDTIWSLLISIVGALVSVVLVLLVERERKPKLAISVEKGNHIHHKRKFLRVIVTNKAIGALAGLFVTRQPALMCRAYITFLTEKNDPVFAKGRRMLGRWSNTPEPAYLLPFNNGVMTIRDPSRTRDLIDIPPDDFEVLDIVMRTEDGETCIGWHNAVIQNPQAEVETRFELPKGRYHVLVSVRTAGQDFRHVFRIVNDHPSIESFRLEDLEPQPVIDRTL